jgi:hypothetical protein
MKILIVLTSHDQLGDTGKRTGFWLEELAAPYYVLKETLRRKFRADFSWRCHLLEYHCRGCGL